MPRLTVRRVAGWLLTSLLLGSAIASITGLVGNLYFYGATIAALLMFAVVTDVWRAAFGWLRTLGAIASMLIITATAIGASLYLDWPLGRFRFTGLLGWEILGLVPWTVPVVWLTILAAALALTQKDIQVAQGRDRYAALFAWCFDAALLATLLDLAIEPLATRAGLKIFAPSQLGFAGVPYQHFLGWFAVSFLCCAAILAWTNGRRLNLDIARLLASTVIWLLVFWIALGLKLDLPLPTVLAFVLLLIVVWKRRRLARDVNVPI